MGSAEATAANATAAEPTAAEPTAAVTAAEVTAAEAAVDAAPGFGFFTAHQARVITEATARLIPGPTDDPAEAGHPGAREAGVTRYLDTTLAALDVAPAPVHMGGPWSDRHPTAPDSAAPDSDRPDSAGRAGNQMAEPVPLSPAQRIAWTRRLAEWRQRYRDGVVLLDTLAGGDFAAAPPDTQDRVLAGEPAAEFVTLLFGHAAEGMYAAPEYGGNHNLAGWRDIGFPGDVHPRGYRAEEVSGSDGPDPAEPDGIVADLAQWLNAALLACAPPPDESGTAPPPDESGT